MDHITTIQSRNTESSPKTSNIQTAIATAMCMFLSACGGDEKTPPTPPPSPEPQYTKINNTTGKRIHYGKNQTYRTGEQIRILFQNQTDKDFEAGKLGIVSKPGDTTRVDSRTQGKRKHIDKTINPVDIFPKGQDITTGEALIKSNNNITTKRKMNEFHINQPGHQEQKESTLLLE